MFVSYQQLLVRNIHYFSLFCSNKQMVEYLFRASVLYLKSHLDQKYDQEVEVRDSSELLKQILGNEVPEGILWDRVAAAGLLSHARKTGKNNNTSSSSSSSPPGRSDAQLYRHKKSEMCHPQKHGLRRDYMVV